MGERSGLGLGVMVFNSISAILWWLGLLGRNPGYTEKATDLAQVTDELNYIMLYPGRLEVSRIRTNTFGGDGH